MKKVSIIIPVYNVCLYIDDCLKSVVEQTYQNLEILLVDDGSTDGSSQKCDTWAQKDDRIFVYHQTNHGVSYARNLAILKSTGVYLSFVDPDDILDEKFIESLVYYIETYDADLSVCGIYKFYDSTSVSSNIKTVELLEGNDMKKALFDEIGGFLANKLYKAEIFRLNHLYLDESISISEDLLLNLDYLKHTLRIVYNKKYLYFYRQYSQSAYHCLENPKWFSVLDTYLKIIHNTLPNEEVYSIILYHFIMIILEAKYRLKFQKKIDDSLKKKIEVLQKKYIKRSYLKKVRGKKRYKIYLFRCFPNIVMKYRRREG